MATERDKIEGAADRAELAAQVMRAILCVAEPARAANPRAWHTLLCFSLEELSDLLTASAEAVDCAASHRRDPE
jgi:hypothetical protein